MSTQKNEGEGSREAARHYNEATRDFVESGQVEEKAREAGNVSEQEKAEMERAEREGRERAKEFDPAVKRD